MPRGASNVRRGRIPTTTAAPASWYVDNAVGTSGNGQSWATAWKLFTDIVWASVNPGDTIYLSGGSSSKTYTGSLVVGKAGTSGNRIHITAGVDSGHDGTVVLDGQQTDTRGIDNGGTSTARDHIKVSFLDIRNYTVAGINFKTTTGGLVEDCVVLCGNGADPLTPRGIDVRDNTDITVRRCTVRTPASTTGQTDALYSQNNSNYLYEGNDCQVDNTDNTGHSDAFQSNLDGSGTVRGNVFRSATAGGNNHPVWIHAVDTGETLKLYNNLCHARGTQFNVSYWRADAGQGDGTVLVYNNTIYGGDRGLNVERAAGVQAKNNIVWPQAAGFAYVESLTAVPAGNVTHNLVWAPSSTNVASTVASGNRTYAQWTTDGYNASGVNDNPDLVAAGSDFRLLAGSPAVNAGTTLADVATDFDAITRPVGAAYDLGAFESHLLVTVTLSGTADAAGQVTEFSAVGTLESGNVGGLAASGSFPQATTVGTTAANALQYIVGGWQADETLTSNWDNTHSTLPASLTTFGVAGADGAAGYRTYATGSGAVTVACGKSANNLYATAFASWAPSAGTPAFVANATGGQAAASAFVVTALGPAAASTLLAGVVIGDGTTTVSTIASGDGRTWSLVRRTANASGVAVELWAGVGGGADADAVTATVTASAQAAVAAVAPEAATATATAAAQPAVAGVSVAAETASMTAAAIDAVASTVPATSATAVTATATAAAQDAVAVVGPAAETAAAAATGQDAAPVVAPSAETVAVAAAAQDATTATEGTAAPTAQTATATAAAQDAAPAVAVATETASATATAQDATAQAGATAQTASVAAAAQDATTALAANATAQTASVTAAAGDAVALTEATVETVTATATAQDATAAVAVAAQTASVTAAAQGATFQRFTEVTAETATVTAAGIDALAAVGVAAQVVLVGVAAQDPVVYIPPPVPPPRWVEGASTATSLLEGTGTGAGLVEGALVGAGSVEGGSSL